VQNPALPGEAYLLDVIGRPARHGGFLFVAVLLDGPMGTRGHHLEAHLERTDSAELPGDYEALWVRARIGRVFGIAPPSPLGKQCLLDAAFLAVRHAPSGPFLEAHPFVCTDSDGEEPVDYEWFDNRVGLAFGPTGRAMKSRIATAFWGLLLAADDDLATFGDYYEFDGGRWRVGCDGHEPFSDDIDYGYDEGDACPAYGLGFDGRWPCPDCDGEGVEFFADLFEQECETCRGTGSVAWVDRDAAG